MWISLTLLAITAAWAVTPAQSTLAYYIVPNDTTVCNLESSTYEACLTLQQFANRVNTTDYFQENITLNFAVGNHFLVGGIELNNSANIVIKGQLEGLQKPKLSCKQKSCFSIRNSSSIHIENLAFIDCFSEDSDGGAIFVSKAEAVNITQCLFVNNFIRKRGGAMRLQLIEKAHILESQFVNNSAICHPSDIISFWGLTFCSMSCTASSGAISAFNITDFLIEVSHFESNTASCFNGAVVLTDSNTDLINNSFVRNSVAASLAPGGGLLVLSGITRLSDCTFEENHAGAGGGISSQSSQMDIINCSFDLNTAGRGGGGAAYFIDTILSIDECSFTQNMAGLGGAIKIDNSNQNVIVSKSKFQWNRNPGLGGSGGAIFFQLSGEPSCTVSCVNDSEVIPNDNMPIVSIVGCTFVSNEGTLRGGAIDAYKGVLNITSSEFKENSASLGGALVSSSNFVFLHGNDFFENRVIAYGGSVYLSNGTMYSSNNTYSNNTGRSGGGAINVIFSTLFSYNDHYSRNNAIMSGGAISALHSDIFCTGCMFLSNRVVASGGAVFVSEGTFSSLESFYEANFASQNGGALFLVRNTANISCDHYSNNIADFGEGAAVFQTDNTIQLYNTTFCDNKAFETDQVYTIRLTNVQGSCSDLTFTRNIGSMYLFSSTLNFSGSVSFTDNNGIVGGALTLDLGTVFFREFSEVSFSGNSAKYGGGLFLSQSEIRVYTPHLMIHNNTATHSGGGIYAYQSQINIRVNETSEPILLSSNSAVEGGGAINAIASNLNAFNGFVLLIYNEAMRGGAISLFEGSKIYVLKTAEEMFNEIGIKLTITNNSAEYGGAVYVADNTNTGVLCRQSTSDRIQSVSTEECFIQTLRLYYPRNFTYSQFNYMNFFFNFNTGTKAGNDIYGGLLDRCQINQFSEISTNFVSFRYELSGFDYLKTLAQFQIEFDYNQITNPFFPRDIIRAINGDSVKSLISSDPVQLCFCENNTRDCSYQWPRIFVKKGEAFAVRAVTVDQVENPVNGTVLANVISKGTQLKVDQSRKDTTGACTELIYTVFSTEANVTFQLYPDGPCDENGISSKTLEITFLPCNCPNGLQPAPLDNECRCECDTFVSTYASSCQQYNNSITVVRQSAEYWIQYEHDKNVTGFLFESCPYDYCVDKPVNLSISLPLNVDKQCAYNRTGIMCGECEEGLSLVFGSSRCMQCSNNYLALLIAFAFAGLALVSFILILNMTVAIGTTHGLILYANIVGANSAVFLPSDSALRFFVSWVNLDLGIETCFYDGMDSYAKVLLQLVFPTYIILLSILTIILSSYWGWFAKLIGGNKNPVATLCTLFLLSYSKLLRTTIASIQFTTLTYPDGSSDILWLYDPNIPYFTPSRISFFIISILIIALGTVYTILLLFGQWIRKIEGVKLLKCFQSNKYNAFIDAYQGPFVVKHRYWIGVLLLARIIHHILSSVSDVSTHLLIVSSVVCALLILKQLVTKVYKNWLISFIETSYFINLLLFSVSTYYVSTTNRDQVAVANTSVAIAFIMFIGIVLYHTHAYFLKSLSIYLKLMSVVKKCLQLSRKITRANSLVLNEDTGENATDINSSLHMSLLREPALDIISPVSDNDYTPPKTSSASADSRKPTSTTVIINQVQVS